MNTDNEKTLMQTLRASDAAGDLLRLPEFAGFASSDEILAARQDGALNAAQEKALNGALASSNALRQQWLALSAAVPHAKHGAVWHGLFRWHWATIGMSACVALVGVLLFHQVQLPLAPSPSFSESVAMREPLAESSVSEADSVAEDRLAYEMAPQAKALKEAPQKRQLPREPATDDFSDEQAEIASAPLMADRAMSQATSRPAPLAPPPPSLPSAAGLMPQATPDWQTWLAVYHGQQQVKTSSDMAMLAQAVLAVDASDCAAADLAALQQAFQIVKVKYPAAFTPLEPGNDAGWCELGVVLEEAAQDATR